MISLYLFWGGELVGGILVTILPPVVASGLVMRYANLENLKESAAGAYLARHMGPAVQGLRLLGALVTIAGAWYHAFWAILVGLLIVLVAWFHGLVRREAPRRAG